MPSRYTQDIISKRNVHFLVNTFTKLNDSLKYHIESELYLWFSGHGISSHSFTAVCNLISLLHLETPIGLYGQGAKVMSYLA